MLKNELSPINKATLIEYSKSLKERGFCKIDNSSSNTTQLYNCFNGTTLPLSYINNDMTDWLRSNDKVCDERNLPYIISTLPHVIGTKFVPKGLPIYKEPKTGCNFVNTYKFYEPSIDSKQVSPLFLEYLIRLIPDDAERHIFVQWIAHTFQRPNERPSWHILLTSDVGTGKGFLIESILHPLLHHTSVVNSFQKVLGQFSTVLEDNLLVLLDDPAAGSDDTQTKLKSMLSEERAYTERKGLQGGMTNTYTRFILASNDSRPLRLDANERRWWSPAPLVHRFNKEETQSFIKELADWLAQDGSLDKVYNWFMDYSLDGFNPKYIAQSANLLQMIGLSENIYTKFLKEWTIDNKVFTTKDVNNAFDSEALGKPNPHQLPHLLRELGFENKKVRFDTGSKSVYYPIGMELYEVKQRYSDHVTATF